MCVFTQHLFAYAAMLTPGPTDKLYVLQLGGVGVLTFFALSGFLIPAKAGDPALKFIIDRARRIFPIFWLSLAFALSLRWATVGPVRHFWDLAFLIPNGRPNPVELPQWSLYFECFFYILVLLVAQMRASWVRPAVILWGVLSFALYQRPYDFAHYNVPGPYSLAFPLYGIYFAVGVLAGWGFRPAPAKAAPYAIAALASYYGLQTSGWTGTYVYLPLWARSQDSGFLLTALGAFFAVRAALCWQPAGFLGRAWKLLGDASYGIYLIHQVLIKLTVMLIRSIHTPHSYLLCMILIAALTLPPSILFGLLDVKIQRALKSLQRRVAIARQNSQPLPLETSA